MLVLSPFFIEFKEIVLKEGDTGKIQDCMTGIVFLLLIQLFVIFFSDFNFIYFHVRSAILKKVIIIKSLRVLKFGDSYSSSVTMTTIYYLL